MRIAVPAIRPMLKDQDMGVPSAAAGPNAHARAALRGS
jgi:hypothetical protein